MERERLTRMLEEPGLVAREDIAGLRDLTDRHPWFTGAHLLLAVGEHAAGDVHYDATLQTAVAHLPARSVLFDAVHRPEVPPPALMMVPAGTDPAHELVLEISEQEATTAAQPPPLASEHLSIDPLNAEIKRAALAGSYELLMLHTAAQAAVPPEVAGTTEPALSQAPASEDQVLPEVSLVPAAGPLKKVPSVNEEAPEVPTSMPPRKSGRMRFTAWLGSPESIVAEPGASGPRTPPDAPPPASGLQRVTPRQSLPVEETAALIDRFIQQTNPEPKARTEFFTPQQAAKRSLDDTAGLVTETLARIYEKQGNFAKAMEAYRKLALKYPDKSAYFAALQRSLEEQQNN